MDISRSQMRNPDQFISEIKSKDENIKYFNEKSNGCIHLEIPQP